MSNLVEGLASFVMTIMGAVFFVLQMALLFGIGAACFLFVAKVVEWIF